MLLSLLLLLMLVTRPLLVLACAVHEDSHPGVHAGHEQTLAPHADEVRAGDHGGFSGALDGVLHLGFCCGHFHLQAAQALVLFVARPPALLLPAPLWPARVAGWSAPEVFRPPIAGS